MKGTGAKRNVCPGSCVSTGAKFPVAPVESAPMTHTTQYFTLKHGTFSFSVFVCVHACIVDVTMGLDGRPL